MMYQLDGDMTQAACTAPYQYNISFLQLVAFPVCKHPIGCYTRCTDASIFIPVIFRRCSQKLYFQHTAELCKRTPVCFIAPHSCGRAGNRVYPAFYNRAVFIILQTDCNDLITDLKLCNILTDSVDNATRF